MEEPAVTEDEEDLDRGRPVGNTSRSLEEEFENIRLEKPEDIKAVVEEFEEIKGEEKKLEDINVEEENLEDNKNGEEELEHTERDVVEGHVVAAPEEGEVVLRPALQDVILI